MNLKRLMLVLIVTLLQVGPSVRSQTAQTGTKKPDRVRTTDELADRKVSLDLKDVTLKEALDTLFKKVPVNRVVMFDTGVDTKITFKVEDVPFEGALMCILRSAKRMSLQYIASSDILVIGPDRYSPFANAVNKKVWIDIKDVDVKFAIKALLDMVHPSYTFDQSVVGQISAVVNAETFDVALKRLCENKAAPVTFRFDDHGTYQFVSAK